MLVGLLNTGSKVLKPYNYQSEDTIVLPLLTTLRLVNRIIQEMRAMGHTNCKAVGLAAIAAYHRNSRHQG